ncbi:MAG: YIP1 family protein [Planctomycetes bacterium]|nr:YIP1 family protein [Planctomycetota bacterium]
MNDSLPKPLWEDQGPFFRRLYNTWKEIAFHPIRFFANMPTDAGIGRPYLYFLITGFIGSLAAVIWLVPIYLIVFLPMAFTEAGWLPLATIMGFLAAMVILSPIISSIAIFIMAGVYHLSLMIFGGNKKGFEATFRSIAYATGSASIGNLIPFFGGWAAMLGAIILTIIGFRESHRIPTVKAILAYLVPLALGMCCAMAMYLAMIFAVMMGLALQGH